MKSPPNADHPVILLCVAAATANNHRCWYLWHVRRYDGSHLGKTSMLNEIRDFSIIIANLGGVLGLSGLLMLNYVFPNAIEQCPAWAKPLFQILAAVGVIVAVGVLILTADQISPVAWAFAASSPPHS